MPNPRETSSSARYAVCSNPCLKSFPDKLAKLMVYNFFGIDIGEVVVF
jgi:hypothetical protein